MARKKTSSTTAITTGTKISIVFLLAVSILTFITSVIGMTLWVRAI